MKKMLLILTYLMFSLLVFAGGSAENTPSQGAVEIKFWHTMTGLQGDYLDQTVALFNASQDRIVVQSTRVPTSDVSDVSKLMAAIAANVGPDVFYVDRNTISQRAYEGILQNLGPYLDEIGWIDPKSEFLDFVWPEVMWQGKVYGIPFESDIRVMYYNIDDFVAAGLDPASPPKTLEQLDSVAKQLTSYDAKGNLSRIGFVPWHAQGSVYTWSVVYGVTWFDDQTKQLTGNSPEMVKALTRYTDYIDRYPGLVRFKSGFGSGETDPFLTGRLSITFDSNKYIAAINNFAPTLKYGIAALPRPEGFEGPTTWAGGYAFSIPMKASDPVAAMEFIRFMGGPVAQTYYCEHNVSLPTNIEAFESISLREDPEQQIFFDLLPYAQVRPAVPLWGKLWPEQHAVRDYIINGQKTPQQAMDDYVKLLQPDIDYIYSLYK